MVHRFWGKLQPDNGLFFHVGRRLKHEILQHVKISDGSLAQLKNLKPFMKGHSRNFTKVLRGLSTF